MNGKDRWLLPDGIDELLPAQAQTMEALRRASLDVLAGWGYELVEPPLIEYLDSLLSGMGEDLDLQTFKLIDQQTGRMLGLRADITLQAARIDVHRLGRDVATRLCYCGPVLHTLSEKFAGSRNPLQLGAELYGCAGLAADAEVITAMLAILEVAGVGPVWLELGHVGVFRALIASAALSPELESALYADLQRKDRSAIVEAIGKGILPQSTGAAVLDLLELQGGAGVLDAARSAFGATPAALRALDELAALIKLLTAAGAACEIHVDLAEMRGYRYYTGAVFAAYVAGQGDAVARGGRYDNVGAGFGRARPATGFSTDLKHLAGMTNRAAAMRSGILAPVPGDAALRAEVARLRGLGERVISALPGSTGRPPDCNRELVQSGNRWIVRALED